MTTVIQIGLDNPHRLADDVQYFEYQGVQFKLVQTEEGRWSDVILTLASEYNDDYIREVYSIAGEYVTALSWELDVGMAVRPIGVLTVGADIGLQEAEPNTFVFPELPSRGGATGYGIGRIGKISNDEQKGAMTLYREACGANKTTLSVLFYWQVLETRGETAVQWVNKLMGNLPTALEDLPGLVEKADTRGKNLGDYLLDDCRHAIAHVNREPGRRELLFDDYDEDRRLAVSNRILKRLARYYIEDDLGVRQRLVLRQRAGGPVPVYVEAEEG